MTTAPDIEGIAVQYVLGELAPEERRDVERRLRDDAALAAEVERLRRVLGVLPLFVNLSALVEGFLLGLS